MFSQECGTISRMKYGTLLFHSRMKYLVNNRILDTKLSIQVRSLSIVLRLAFVFFLLKLMFIFSPY